MNRFDSPGDALIYFTSPWLQIVGYAVVYESLRDWHFHRLSADTHMSCVAFYVVAIIIKMRWPQ